MNQPQQAILNGLSSQVVATFYVAGVSALLAFFLARMLGPAEFGYYSYILAIASLIGAAQDLGFRTVVVRETTMVTPQWALSPAQLFGQALGNNAIVTLLSVVVVAMLPFADRTAMWSAITCFGLVVVCQTISARYRGEGKFVADARWQITGRTVSALAIALVVTSVAVTPTAIFLAWGGALLVFLVVFGRLTLELPRLPAYRKIGPTLAALVFVDLATSVYFKIDIVMLNHMATDSTEVGYYSAAYKFLEGAVLLITPVGYVTFRMLRERWNDSKVFSQMLQWGVAAMTMVGILCAVVGAFLAPMLIGLAYGHGYARSSALLSWLVVALIFLMPNYVLTQAAIAMNRERAYAFIATTAAIFNIALNMWLIPLHGAMGAAWATVATEAWLCVLLAIGAVSWRKGMNTVVTNK